MNTIFEVRENEILFIYHSDKFRDREAYGYMKSISDYVIKEIDLSREDITETQLMDIADRLEVRPSQLIDYNSDVYKNEYKNKNLETEDVLKAIRQNPSLLHTPIAVYTHRAYLVKTPYDLPKKGMDTPKGIDTDKR